jgi:hypothetical protein
MHAVFPTPVSPTRIMVIDFFVRPSKMEEGLGEALLIKTSMRYETRQAFRLTSVGCSSYPRRANQDPVGRNHCSHIKSAPACVERQRKHTRKNHKEIEDSLLLKGEVHSSGRRDNLEGQRVRRREIAATVGCCRRSIEGRVDLGHAMDHTCHKIRPSTKRVDNKWRGSTCSHIQHRKLGAPRSSRYLHLGRSSLDLYVVHPAAALSSVEENQNYLRKGLQSLDHTQFLHT